MSHPSVVWARHLLNGRVVAVHEPPGGSGVEIQSLAIQTSRGDRVLVYVSRWFVPEHVDEIPVMRYEIDVAEEEGGVPYFVMYTRHQRDAVGIATARMKDDPKARYVEVNDTETGELKWCAVKGREGDLYIRA